MATPGPCTALQSLWNLLNIERKIRKKLRVKVMTHRRRDSICVDGFTERKNNKFTGKIVWVSRRFKTENIILFRCIQRRHPATKSVVAGRSRLVWIDLCRSVRFRGVSLGTGLLRSRLFWKIFCLVMCLSGSQIEFWIYLNSFSSLHDADTFWREASGRCGRCIRVISWQGRK